MSPELEVLLRAVLADPTRLGALAPEQERTLVSSLRAVVGQPHSASTTCAPASPVPVGGLDDLLTVFEAAALLRVSPRWLYRHAPTLPFARKLSRKVLRFSRTGISRWLATKRL